MRRWLGRPGAWALLSVCCLASSAKAQIGAPGRPQTSPYATVPPALNMRGQAPVMGYFGIVRPQQETNRTLQQLQNDFSTQQHMINTLPEQFQDQGQANPLMSTSGHTVSFFNTRQYFSGPNNRFSLGGATNGGAGGGAFGQPNHAIGVPVAPGLNQRR